MTDIFPKIFEILVTSLEVGLFFYFISKQLTPKNYFHTYFPICFFAMIALTYLQNHFGITVVTRFTTTLLMEIFLTFLLTTGSDSAKLFWGCLYRIIDFLSDTLTILIFNLVTQHDFPAMVSAYPMRYVMCSAYLILLATFTVFLTHIKKRNIALPRWILPAFVAVIILGIVAVETLLNIIIYFDIIDDYSQSKILYLAIWIFLSIFVFLLLLIVYLNLLYKNNTILMEKQKIQQFEKQQYELISNNVQVLRVWKHDYKQHFSVIDTLVRNGNIEDALAYIRDINQDFDRSQFHIFTGNSVLDAIISTKLVPIREHQIPFSHSIYLPKELPFDHIALSSLMGNMLDNAIEACLQIEDSSLRYIKLMVKPHHKTLSIIVENSSNGIYCYDNNQQLQSTKDTPDHGIGLKRIREISENVNGFCQIQPEDNKFTVTVVVPLETLQ